MTHFQKSDLVVDGVRVQLLEAGKGEPLVYFHGADASRGFDDLLPLTEKHRLIIPIHPGFGGSDDDPTIDSVVDYVVHYAALFDALKLHEPVDLVGHSLGGWIASLFAIFQGHRVHRLALACPAGLRVPEHPGADLFMISAREAAIDPRGLADGAGENEPGRSHGRHEGGALSRNDLARPSCLGVQLRSQARPLAETHLGANTHLVGRAGQSLPVQQARRWAVRLACEAEISTFDGVGHLVFWELRGAVKRVASFLNGAGS